MYYIYAITLFVIALYLLYPVWLGLRRKTRINSGPGQKIEGVSLVLLSYNGKPYLEEKIRFLLSEMKAFSNAELIVIDDYSADGSVQVLSGFRENDNIQVHLKDRHRGLPDSIETAVMNSNYPIVVFADQRQTLEAGVMMNLVKPLIDPEVGAVSGCINQVEQAQLGSLIRCHENYLKEKESLHGSLIGVYGPLYAMNKDYYNPIPENIILDDLYLSLKILKNKKIIMNPGCCVHDQDNHTLYNYHRARRYLEGLLQLLKVKNLIRDLSAVHRLMLFWHKYLRLIIPLLLAFSLFAAGLMFQDGVIHKAIFFAMTFSGIISLIPFKIPYISPLTNLIRIMIYYFIASVDLFFSKLLNSNPRNATFEKVGRSVTNYKDEN